MVDARLNTVLLERIFVAIPEAFWPLLFQAQLGGAQFQDRHMYAAASFFAACHTLLLGSSALFCFDILFKPLQITSAF